MSLTDYKKNITEINPSYEGNIISKCCHNFLSRMLSKTNRQRLSITEALSHTWVVKIKEKVNEIVEKYNNDSEKMIYELNKATVDDSYFEIDKGATNVTTTSDDDNSSKKHYLSKKRKNKNCCKYIL